MRHVGERRRQHGRPERARRAVGDLQLPDGGRVDRIGQKFPVKAYNLIFETEIERETDEATGDRDNHVEGWQSCLARLTTYLADKTKAA